MGFLNNTPSIELKAKLTPKGRIGLITNDNNLITSFSLGDSDSYYSVFSGLTGGQVPQISGNYYGADTNNGGIDYVLKSVLKFNSTTLRKPIETQSINVSSFPQSLGYNDLYFSAGTFSQQIVDLKDLNSDSLVNLFYSFNLPISDSDFMRFTGTTFQNGGFSNTALGGLATDKILVIGIDGSEYSELIDGKSIKLSLETSIQPYEVYSTYEIKGISLTNEDSAVTDSSTNVANFGPNRVLLFSDDVKRPNGNPLLSWATGYAQNKPFSVNGKQLFNYRGNVNTSTTPDEAIGIAYLDKGFIVITHPDIVDNFVLTGSTSSATTISFNTIRNRVSQSITCIANRGEFGVSTNPTWATSDVPRITEIGLYDSNNTLIAIGKLNRTYDKPVDDFVAFNITIDY
jgi:hypothetical protein